VAENRIEDSTIKKSVVMEGDVKNTSNVFKGSEAQTVRQRINTQEQNLSLIGFGKARGRFAVVSLFESTTLLPPVSVQLRCNSRG
jgi:hypothetical protein